MTHLKVMGEAHIVAFLLDLAMRRNCSLGTESLLTISLRERAPGSATYDDFESRLCHKSSLSLKHTNTSSEDVLPARIALKSLSPPEIWMISNYTHQWI
jgi:hypothetical protein